MAERIFLRDVAGLKAGQIADLDWTAFVASAATHHGVVIGDLDEYAIPLEEAARRHVAGLRPKPVRETGGKDPNRLG